VVIGPILPGKRLMLQWGRAKNRAERRQRELPARLAQEASMGPREKSRGK